MQLNENVSIRYKNLTEMLQKSVEKYPNKDINYVGTDGNFKRTYQEEFEHAKKILANLQQLGIKKGDHLVVALEKNSTNIPMLWACILGGIIACPITIKVSDSDLWKKTLLHISKTLDKPTFIISEEDSKYFNSINNEVITIESLDKPTYINPKINYSEPNDIAFFMLSSGSTGAPKAIELTHKNILSSLEGKRLMTTVSNDDVIMNWIAYDHVASLIESHLLALYVGASQIQVLPIDIVSDPLFFLKTISKYKVTHTFTPNFLFGQIIASLDNLGSNSKELEGLDLSSVKRIISGGEANVTQTGEKILGILKKYGIKENVIWPAFGMTETCAGSIYSKDFFNEFGKLEFGSLGKPVPGLKIRIVDKNNNVLENGKEGYLQLKGNLIFNKYHNNVQKTNDAFSKDGWFFTGDLGMIDSDTGFLKLSGRSKDSIIVNGVNYYLHDVETKLEAIKEIEPSFITSFSTRKYGDDTESLVIFYTPKKENNNIKDLLKVNNEVRNLVILYCGFRPSLILPVPKSVLGKTSLGKIQTSKIKKKFENGVFDNLISTFNSEKAKYLPKFVKSENESEQNVINLFSIITGVPKKEIGATTSFLSLGGTSLETLRLLSGLKKMFENNQFLDLIHILKNPTPRGIVNLINTKDSEDYNPIVPLQTKGSKYPIFMIHPGVGEVLIFINFANLFINEHPIYALRARGFNKGEKYFNDFDELVDTYVDAIKEVQPHGPYYISGYSYGGPVSLPVAQKLEKQGEKVHLLVIDAPPMIEHPRGKVDRVESALMLSFFLGFINKDQLDSLGEMLRNSPNIDPSEYLFKLAPKKRIKELNQDLNSFKHWNDLAYNLAQIGAKYKPSGKVNDVRVFYADPIWGKKSEYLNHTLKKWNKFSNNPVKYIEIPGEHHTILTPEFVNKFHSIFVNELNEINKGGN